MFFVNPAYAERVQQAIATLSEAFGYTFAGDMMLTFHRNMGFYEDARFMKAFNEEAADEREKSLVWRLHVLCWFARQALRVEGDFVECGVFRGFSTIVAARMLDFARSGRQWFLYDTFTGVPADQLNPGGEGSPELFAAPGLYEACLKRFAPYQNIHVVRGRIPEVLAERAPARVAFLHLDLNSAAAESAAFEFLRERFAPGAVVLLDDYGWRGFRPQKLVADEFFGSMDRPILELPTGQGVVIV
ncbi:MAG: class I SAM-dependent methyltransferase [Betaproteobacteria bacterium]|nr:class I SAM-dependent methyltransferase [Betaproteobacteria bacterium]MDH5220273.1 class I SAM-dependent methyltransferase [Betaproteobacteria bacterium]MDH5352648.1 class I SAM-dependent methyltransferase [Betaproteobacteria bacterium]